MVPVIVVGVSVKVLGGMAVGGGVGAVIGAALERTKIGKELSKNIEEGVDKFRRKVIPAAWEVTEIKNSWNSNKMIESKSDKKK